MYSVLCTVADPQGAEIEELMQNKDFLESVLSTLPGVNPEQALLNLREMTEAAGSSTGQTQEGDDEEEKMEEGEEEKKVTISFRINIC